MKWLKQIIENKKEKYRLQDEANLMADFKVMERGGSLWLTHCGVAFMKINSDDSAADVTKLLAEVRFAAITFERL